MPGEEQQLDLKGPTEKVSSVSTFWLSPKWRWNKTPKCNNDEIFKLLKQTMDNSLKTTIYDQQIFQKIST